MLKKSFKVLALLVILLLIVFSTTSVLAEDNEITTMNADESVSIVGNEDDYNTKKGDQYLTGDNVVVDTDIDGNVFIIAKTVKLSSSISGDVFVLSEDVQFTENCSIDGNVFLVSKDASINGSVMYNVYAAAENIKIPGYILKDVYLSVTNSINILGTISRDANIFGTSNITFEDGQHSNRGLIVGSLKYSATEQAQIPDGIVASGVNYTPITEKEAEENPLVTHLIALGCSLVLLIVIWLVGLGLAPKFIHNSGKLLKTKIVPSILFGVISIIVIPFIALALFITTITIPAALLTILVYILLLVISSSVFLISLNNILCENFKINGNGGKFIELLILGALYYVICLIPYVGILLKILSIVIGSGLIVANLIYNKNKVSKKQTAK